MRTNIFDILEGEMNLEYEIETIVNLFNEARIYGFNINPELFFEKVRKTRKDILLNRKITKTNVVCPT